MSKRQKFTPEFRKEAVELVLSSRKKPGRGFRITGNQRRHPGNWVRAYRTEHPETETEEHRPVEMGPAREAAQGIGGGETGERIFKRCQRLFRLEGQEISAILIHQTQRRSIR